MNEISTSHHTIVVKRTYPATPKQVFAAWTDPKALAKWYVPGDANWTSRIERHDFRVGGVKLITFGETGAGAVHRGLSLRRHRAGAAPVLLDDDRAGGQAHHDVDGHRAARDASARAPKWS